MTVSTTTERLTLYVPRDSAMAFGIMPGSVIVGSGERDGEIFVDYEGGLYNADRDLEDMLQSAAGRHVQRYPTVARALLPAEEMKAVGQVFHDQVLRAWVFEEISDPDALEAWISPHPLPVTGGSEKIRRRAAGLHYTKVPPHRMAMIQQQAQRGEADMVDLILREARG